MQLAKIGGNKKADFANGNKKKIMQMAEIDGANKDDFANGSE